jgi:hypothetical protein
VNPELRVFESLLPRLESLRMEARALQDEALAETDAQRRARLLARYSVVQAEWDREFFWLRSTLRTLGTRLDTAQRHLARPLGR